MPHDPPPGSPATPSADQLAALLPEYVAIPAEGPAPAGALPAAPAVLLLLDEAGRPIQLSITQNARRALAARLDGAPDADALADEPDDHGAGAESAERPPDAAGGPTITRQRADLRQITRGVRWHRAHCAFEARWQHYRAARLLYPEGYRALIAFGPACYLTTDLTAPAPEIRITEQPGSGACLGPWPTRAACGEAQQLLWDLFELCRYPEQVRQAPRGQRCAYADMGRCDAPCDGSAPLAAYAARSAAAWRFAGGAIAPWLQEARQRMQTAAQALRFEAAALLKQQIEAAQRWQRHATRHVRDFATAALLLGYRVPGRTAFKFLLHRSGHIADGPVLRGAELSGAAAAFAMEALRAAPPDLPRGVRAEQAWLAANALFRADAASAVLLWMESADAAQPDAAERIARQISERVEQLRAASAKPPAR